VKRRAPAEVDVRAQLIAKMRTTNGHYGHLRPGEEYPHGLTEAEKDARRVMSVWGDCIARLEAGEPVEVYGWQLPKLARPDGGGRFRIESDGSVTAITR
jgi:hypothetical protein